MPSYPLKRLLLSATLLSLVQVGSALAVESASTPPPPDAPAPGMMMHSHEMMEMHALMGHPGMGLDWVEHTKHMLADLKTKLNLTPPQLAGWDNWAAHVQDGTRNQVERIRHWHEEHLKIGMGAQHAPQALTTPDRMALGVQHMKAEIQRMQDHVAFLERSAAATKIFYDTLDTNQKTIFDLYWQQTYQAGLGVHSHMQPHGMGLHGGSGNSTSPAGYDVPAGQIGQH